MAVLDKAKSIERDGLEIVEEMPNIAKARLGQSHLSQAEKDDFLAGFNKSLQGSRVYTSEEHMVTVAQEWADATVNLYRFALVGEHSAASVRTDPKPGHGSRNSG